MEHNKVKPQDAVATLKALSKLTIEIKTAKVHNRNQDQVRVESSHKMQSQCPQGGPRCCWDHSLNSKTCFVLLVPCRCENNRYCILWSQLEPTQNQFQGIESSFSSKI